MAIWAELKKVVNSDFSKPLNTLIDTWGDTLKTAITNSGSCYALYGTTTTLASCGEIAVKYASTASTNSTKILSFTAPLDGDYRLDVSFSGTNNHTGSGKMYASIYVKGVEFNGSVSGSSYTTYYEQDILGNDKDYLSHRNDVSGFSSGTTLTSTITKHLVLKKGFTVEIYAALGDDISGTSAQTIVGKVTSAKVRYVKKYS